MAGKAVIGRAVLELSTDGKDLSEGLDKAEAKTKGWGENVGGIAKAGVLAIGVAAISMAAASVKAAYRSSPIARGASARRLGFRRTPTPA